GRHGKNARKGGGPSESAVLCERVITLMRSYAHIHGPSSLKRMPRRKVSLPPAASAAPDAPLPVTQRRSQETLDRLLAAAENALREEGPDGATLRSIAERAG